MESDTNKHFARLVTTLIDLLNKKESGAIIGSLEGSVSYFQIYIEMGEIVAVTYEHKSGVEAIKTLKGEKPVNAGFHPNRIPERYDKLPGNEQILDYWQVGASSGLVKANDSAFSNGLQERISQVTLHRIKQLFQLAVGPIGDVIFDRELANSSSQEDLIDRLLQHIQFPEDREQFYREVS